LSYDEAKVPKRNGVPMTVAKKSKPKRAPKKTAAKLKDWRDAIRLHLSMVPSVDAVFVCGGRGTIHVYSIVEELREECYKGLLEQEDAIEKAFPEKEFEFHTSAHQGRDPSESGRLFTQLIYLRK
jgi:hypothetical protein